MGFREMRGGDGVSDVEIRRNEIIELLYTYKKYSIDDFAKRLHYQSWMQMQSSTKFCAEQNCNLITAQQGMTIRQQCKSSAPAKNSNPQIHFQNHSTAPSSAKSSYTSIHISTSNCETDRHYNKEEHHEQRKNHRNSSH